YRQVVESPLGKKDVIYGNGYYFKVPGSKITTYPNLVTIAYTKQKTEATVNQDMVEIRFMDATMASAEVFVKYALPNSAELMLKCHEDFRNVDHLAATGLAPYTRECLKYSTQLMESEQHYSGGMSKLSNDFRDQLDNGQYVVDNFENTIRDSTTGELTKTYENRIRMDDNNLPVRNSNDLRDMGIVVRTHNIINVDYEKQVEEKLAKKIEASTRESVSKQNLITAQQEELTAAAEGRKRLVEIEYEQKQSQTTQMVQAETQVKLAEQDRQKQEIALRGAKLEAQKIKALADAEAYAKQKIMQADGALEKKLKAYESVQKLWAGAFANYKGDLVPTIQTGGGTNGSNAGLDFMEVMGAKAAMDLGLNLDVQKKN
ncbi:MAG: SPFH domain-containing protein, partial [Saprospiraceae bacterium]